MSPKPAIKGLYAITPGLSDTSELLHKARFVLQGGARVLQYRNKSGDAALRLQQAQVLRALTRKFSTTFIVNDDVQLALESDADGVHLGGGDVGVAEARKLLGRCKLIGASCYNRESLAFEAVEAGADYVAFGAFFPSSVKPDAVRADIGILRSMRKQLSAPIVAIGGITQQNGAGLIEAGADALAVIAALWDASDIERAANEFSQLFSRTQQ